MADQRTSTPNRPDTPMPEPLIYTPPMSSNARQEMENITSKASSIRRCLFPVTEEHLGEKDVPRPDAGESKSDLGDPENPDPAKKDADGSADLAANIVTGIQQLAQSAISRGAMKRICRRAKTGRISHKGKIDMTADSGVMPDSLTLRNEAAMALCRYLRGTLHDAIDQMVYEGRKTLKTEHIDQAVANEIANRKEFIL